MLKPFIDADTARLAGFTNVMRLLEPRSPYGQSAKQAMRPFLPGAEAELRTVLSKQAELLALYRHEAKLFLRLEHLLSQLVDWRDARQRAAAGATLSDVDLFRLKQLLYFLNSIKQTLKELPVDTGLPALFSDYHSLAAKLDPEGSGNPSFYIADAYSPSLAKVRQQLRRLNRLVRDFAQEQQKILTEQTGLRFLPSGELMVGKFDREKRKQLADLPSLKVSRETYTEVYYERQLSPEESAWADEIASLKEQEDSLAEEVREDLSDFVRRYLPELTLTLSAIGSLDLLLAKVNLAAKLKASLPDIVDGSKPVFNLRAGTHPQVAAELGAKDRRFTPVSIALGSGVSIITGANMGGKTVSLRLVGLLATMAQYGLLVPAESLTCTLFEAVRLVSAEYSADTPGLSRFGTEVEGLLSVLPQAEGRCLLLCDELASSTNPAEGAALAQAVIEHLISKQSVSLFTTHYESLARLEGVDHWQVVGLSRANEGELAEIVTDEERSWRELADLMDYNLQRVPAGRAIPREALRVAKMMGLPVTIIGRATALLHSRTEDVK